MTTPGEALDGAAARRALQAVATGRLHPLSWLFILLQQLKSFALPIGVLLFSGRGEQSTWELWGLAVAGVLALVSVWRYFTFRYGFADRALVIRSGLLERNLRVIPFDRVQNVTLHQTLLHRLARVAEVRLESAAGGHGGLGRAEAQMQVLPLAEAHALEATVRGAGRVAAGADAVAVPPPGPEATRWLHLPTAELVRLGLISNRGMLVVAGAFAALTQAGEGVMDDVGKAAFETGKRSVALAEGWQPGPLAWAAGALLLLVALFAAVRLLSIGLAIIQFHDFQLWSGPRELRVERGLLNRIRTHLPKRRIQAYSLTESFLHRRFRRQSLRVDRASNDVANEAQSVRDLVPLATPASMDAILAALLPGAAWPPQRWHPLHARAWWRVFALPALLVVLATVPLVAWRGPPALCLLALLPALLLRARLWARYSAWSLEDGVVAFRQGWLDRHWRFVETAKVHAVSVHESPFDRRHGMASVLVDTLGTSPLVPSLRVPYLPAAEARALAEALRAAMPRDPGVNRARTVGSAVPGG
ncbi:MAG: PH domain-containing protein [Lysobacteraceae bacterium]